LEVDVQQGNFKILQLLPQVLILFLVEKWIPPSRSETILESLIDIYKLQFYILLQGAYKKHRNWSKQHKEF
jgi:hypothetical protein